MKRLIGVLFLLFSAVQAFAQQKEMLIRIAEVEIAADYLNAYKKILQEEAEATVRLEPGVITIFPMYQKENLNHIRILEIYANQEAYAAHLKTPHFLKYKTSTQKMVKSLKLVDMQALDADLMNKIFLKLKL